MNNKDATLKQGRNLNQLCVGQIACHDRVCTFTMTVLRDDDTAMGELVISGTCTYDFTVA